MVYLAYRKDAISSHNVGGVSTRSGNCAPSRQGCVISGQKTKANNKWVHPLNRKSKGYRKVRKPGITADLDRKKPGLRWQRTRYYTLRVEHTLFLRYPKERFCSSTIRDRFKLVVLNAVDFRGVHELALLNIICSPHIPLQWCWFSLSTSLWLKNLHLALG